MGTDPFVQSIEAANAVEALLIERFAELRLSTGPDEIRHQRACQRQRDRSAEIFGDHGEGHVESGSDACGGPEFVVLDEDRIGFNAYRRIGGGQRVA